MTDVAQPIHPLRIADFRNYLLARLCTTLGQNSLVIILAWQAYGVARHTMTIKESTAQLGLIGLAQFLPLFFLTPVTGWLADHYDRRRISAMTSVLLMACAATLALATYEGWVSLPLIFTIAVFLGIARGFNGPAMSSLTPRIVPRESLPRAIALSSVVWQTAAIVGPALGGTLFAMVAWVPYALASILFIISIIGISMIAPIKVQEIDKTRHPLRQMIDGLDYVRTNKLVLGAITLDLMAVWLAGATALLPVYARDILHVGSSGLGQLAAAPGVGAALSALWLGIHPIQHNVGNKMLAAVSIFGLATAIFGLTAFMPSGTAHYIALAALFTCGIADMVSVFIRQSLIQIYTPDSMRGRVSSVSQLTISASNELGEAESGLLASLIGPVATVVLGGLGAIGITVLWSRLFPQLGLARSFDMDDMENEGHRATEKTEVRT